MGWIPHPPLPPVTSQPKKIGLSKNDDICGILRDLWRKLHDFPQDKWHYCRSYTIPHWFIVPSRFIWATLKRNQNGFFLRHGKQRILFLIHLITFQNSYSYSWQFTIYKFTSLYNKMGKCRSIPEVQHSCIFSTNSWVS